MDRKSSKETERVRDQEREGGREIEGERKKCKWGSVMGKIRK